MAFGIGINAQKADDGVVRGTQREVPVSAGLPAQGR